MIPFCIIHVIVMHAGSVLMRSNNNTIAWCSCQFNTNGIWDHQTVLANVLDNNSHLNTEYGIEFAASGNNSLIQQNNCLNNTISGIDIDTSNDITIINNICTFNTQSGITIESGSNFLIQQNNCSDNKVSGISLSNSND